MKRFLIHMMLTALVVVMISFSPSEASDSAGSDDDLFSDYDTTEQQVTTVSDPFYWLNYGIYTFNDRLYYWGLKPLATGYKVVVPTPVRHGIRNFFNNLMFPVRFVNSLLQGKFHAAGTELDTFLINTTIGVLGFMNPAYDTYAIVPSEEDFGQTMGAYNIGEGFYLVLPIFGPSTFRDALGKVGDYFITPLTYVDPQEAALGLTALDKINDTSFRLGDYETLKSSAIDHYVSMKDAYIQYRRLKVSE